MPDDLSHLRDLVARHATGPRTATLLPDLRLQTSPAPTTPMAGVLDPVFCLVLQGAKHVTIGDRLLRYDPASYFLASIELSATGWVGEASAEQPYLAMSMSIDRAELAQLAIEVPAKDKPSAGFAVSAVTPELLSPVRRMLELLEAPQDAPILGPMIRREILYRLLQGEQGASLRQVARPDSRLSQVQRAVSWIRAHYDRPSDVMEMASHAGMSRASFHRHFKAATAMSPLQFRQALRLQEARRLMLSHVDAQEAAFRVGYESPSQFSRDYARLFGAPPRRDIRRLAQGAARLAEV